ncbi:MAG: HNH endonuclease [Pseudonocardia sp.]|nr:HNH endonuclease [Pseudonocardia sp.]
MSDDEEWREIPGYEGRYEVSSHGRVRSMPFWANNRWGPMLRSGKIRSAKPDKRGYRAVWLSDGAGGLEKVRVHRLVLLAFVGPPPEGAPHGLHEDDDRSNNHVSNLYWGDQLENANDCIENGHNYQLIKTVCPLKHQLIEPNLVEWQADSQEKRACLACSLTANNHRQDAIAAAAGKPRTRCNRGRDGFTRRIGESFKDEAHRRYAHIMRDHVGGA